VTNLRLSAPTIRRDGHLVASVDVTNTGGRAGDDVVQIYLHDPVASISQPVRRLRGFQRVTLRPGQAQTVSITLDPEHPPRWAKSLMVRRHEQLSVRLVAR